MQIAPRTQIAILVAGFIALFMCGFALVLAAPANGYTIYTGGTEYIIQAHGYCRIITNYTGYHMFVPTRTSGEWSNFIVYKPSGVGLSDCTCYCLYANYIVCYDVGYYNATGVWRGWDSSSGYVPLLTPTSDICG